MNPYKELNVPEDASTDEIKKAFRDLSKEHHPDKGGDHEKFAHISSAYMILKDPDKRSYYDKHGGDKPAQDPIFSEAMGLFSKIVEQIIDHHGDNIIYRNIILEMTAAVNINLTQLNKERDNCNKDILHIKEKQLLFKEKLKFKQEKSNVNIFDYILAARMDAIINKLSQLDFQEKVLNMVILWISDFEFSFEQTPTTPTQNTHPFDQFKQMIGSINRL